jgi:DNA repair protein RadA/Sms
MKLKTVYICQQCGSTSLKWLGKCPDCDEWNSFIEDVQDLSAAKRSHQGLAGTPTPLTRTEFNEDRILTNFEELDRVLGGGIVQGSLILISGEPGIGKSTLTLNICEKISQKYRSILYISGEESPHQIALRAKRLKINNENINLLPETNLENILATVEKNKPGLLIIDSIQVVSSSQIPGISGSISQVRYCAETLMSFAKKTNTPVIIIGHVTKDGNLAGPKILEHLVDTVLIIEGDRYQNLRILRSLKNRFGSTNEVGLFEMTENGLTEVKNASKLFLDGRKINSFGSSITATVEGTRPILLEVQALTNQTPFGYPKRAASGFDINRLQLLIAVIQKHLHINLSDHDVYINIVGGYKLNDPAADLAVIMAIISSFKKISLPDDTVYIGEVGLSGELRSIANLSKRISEASKIGFKNILTPKFDSNVKTTGINVIQTSDITDSTKSIKWAN